MSLLILLSPAKTQQFEIGYSRTTQPRFKQQTRELHTELKKYSATKLAKLFTVSTKIAELNYQRFQDFDPDHYTKKNAKPCLFAFQGDAYRSLQAEDLPTKAIDFLQQHLRIISGYYGLLRPLDLIQPYRLEMSTPLKNTQGNNLYDYWQPTLTHQLINEANDQNSECIVNLASQEYAKAIQHKELAIPFISIDFKQQRNGTYKTIGILAKRARGLMTRYLAENNIQSAKQLMKFNLQGYRFSRTLSNDTHFVFTQKET